MIFYIFSLFFIVFQWVCKHHCHTECDSGSLSRTTTSTKVSTDACLSSPANLFPSSPAVDWPSSSTIQTTPLMPRYSQVSYSVSPHAHQLIIPQMMSNWVWFFIKFIPVTLEEWDNT
jgi:hypothetical protein